MKSFIISAPSPFKTLCITCDNEHHLADILVSRLPDQLSSSTWLQRDSINHYSLRVRLCGGKGGFGSQLRASRGRKTKNNKDAMADVSGRKVRTLQAAQTVLSALRSQNNGDGRASEKREELVRIIEAQEKGSSRTVFEDEAYLLTTERLVEDLKCAMRSAHEEQGEEDTEERGTTSGSRGTSHHGENSHRPRKLPGWDDEDDFDSDEASDAEQNPEPVTTSVKGKEKAVAPIKDIHVRKRVKAS